MRGLQDHKTNGRLSALFRKQGRLLRQNMYTIAIFLLYSRTVLRRKGYVCILRMPHPPLPRSPRTLVRTVAPIDASSARRARTIEGLELRWTMDQPVPLGEDECSFVTSFLSLGISFLALSVSFHFSPIHTQLSRAAKDTLSSHLKSVRAVEQLCGETTCLLPSQYISRTTIKML